MLIIGLICNLLVRPVADKWFMGEAELAEERRLAHDRAMASDVGQGSGTGGATPTVVVVLARAAVGIPPAWGVYRTFLGVLKLFH